MPACRIVRLEAPLTHSVNWKDTLDGPFGFFFLNMGAPGRAIRSVPVSVCSHADHVGSGLVHEQSKRGRTHWPKHVGYRSTLQVLTHNSRHFSSANQSRDNHCGIITILFNSRSTLKVFFQKLSSSHSLLTGDPFYHQCRDCHSEIKGFNKRHSEPQFTCPV